MPDSGFLAVEGHDRRKDVGDPLRRVELASLLARSCGELANQVLVGIAERVTVGGELRQPLGDLSDDCAELGVSVGIGLAELLRAEIDLREKPGEGALERFVFDVLEAGLECVEQFAILRAGHVGDAGPEVRGLDDVMSLEPHLLFKRRHIAGILFVPNRQRGPSTVAHSVRVRIVSPEFFLRGLLVVVREVAKEQEREHVVAEVVRIHRPSELVSDVPQSLAELLLLLVSHVASLIALVDSPGNSSTRLNGYSRMKLWSIFRKYRLFSSSISRCSNIE